MSYVIAAPEEFASAARNLANIGVTINAANANAILATTEVIQPVPMRCRLRSPH